MRQAKRPNPFGFAIGVIAGLLISLTVALGWWFTTPPAPPPAPPAAPEGVTPPVTADSRSVHVLVLGVDEHKGDTGRSDTMMLVRIESDDAVRMLSIPRDTLVEIEGHGQGKVNSAYTYGGADLAKQAVSRLLGVSVDYHVKVNLAGFRHLVDLMGGVTVDVPKAMRYHDPYADLVIDLKPGRQLLDGDKAEQFVRYRYDEMGDDVGRIHRQQDFLKAAAAQFLSPSNLPRIPKLIYTAGKYLETDLPLTQQITLAHAIYSAHERKAVTVETLPGHGDYVEGISFFLPDRQALDRLVATWGSQTRWE